VRSNNTGSCVLTANQQESVWLPLAIQPRLLQTAHRDAKAATR